MGGSRARKQQRKELMDQQLAEGDAARRQRADDEATIVAARDAQRVAAEREVLSDQAEAEAIRQARLASVETDVDIATVSGSERERRRKAFQEGSALL